MDRPSTDPANHSPDDTDSSRKLPSRWRPWVAILGVVALVALAGAGWWFVPLIYAGVVDESARVDATVTTRASVLAGLAGIGALVTIAINYRNSQINARTLRNTQETFRETFRITERGHLTERYSKAIELLGNNDSVAVRLGGVFALQQIAVDSRRDSDQAAVVEVLSAFVRLNLRVDQREVEKEFVSSISKVDPSEPRADVLSAISVLGQLPEREEAPLRADFTGLDFSGVKLTNARLRASNFAGVRLTSSYLAGADLSHSDLRRAHLANSDLRSADLSNAALDGADLTGADLDGASLQGASAEGARFHGANLTGAILMHASLNYATLTDADLSHANIVETNLMHTNLTGTNLRRANLTKANLADTRLAGANLENATMTEADLTGAHAGPSYFGGLGRTSVNLVGAKDLTHQQLLSMIHYDDDEN